MRKLSRGTTGLEKHAPIVKNSRGGESSQLAFSYHLIDPIALQELARTMAHGEQHGYKRDNWRLLSIEEHLNHLLMHVVAYMSGDKQDNHLSHAFARAMMIVALEHRPDYMGCAKQYKSVDEMLRDIATPLYYKLWRKYNGKKKEK